MRPKRDSVEILSQRTNRYIVRILHKHESLIGSEIGEMLEEYAKIRFKSTSSLTESLQNLRKHGFIEKQGARYILTRKARQRWVVKILNLLVDERIDRNGTIVKMTRLRRR